MTVFLCALSGQAREGSLPETVPFVDIPSYMGTWFEIARYPNRFQRNCTDVTATYSLRPDGRVTVVNACRNARPAHAVRSIKGVAWVVDRATNARLKVRFFWPFSGDYWIFALGARYEYALVGSPSRAYLWVLSRTAVMDEKLYSELCTRAAACGFDPARLERTPQTSSSY